MFDYKPDYEQSKERIDAFWERELIDRPVVQFVLAKPPDERVPEPASHHATSEERWLDTEYQVELHSARLANHRFLGDSMPVAYPNLGPEVLSSFYGCPIHFGDFGTSWTDPILDDWAEADQLQLDWESPYLKKIDEITDAFLEAGKDKYIVGMADWHPGGDGIAALREPQRLAIDMLENPDAIKAFLPRITADFQRVYDRFYDKLRAHGQPISTWLPLVSDLKYYIPSNDFSIMISKPMFDDVFLPGLIEECRFLDRSIYHLDGPGALHHLDSILSIEELDALQFVPGAGNEGFAQWVPVYQRAQAAGKAIEVFCTLDEIDHIIDVLDPHGLYLWVEGVPSVEAADGLLDKLERWGVREVS